MSGSPRATVLIAAITSPIGDDLLTTPGGAGGERLAHGGRSVRDAVDDDARAVEHEPPHVLGDGRAVAEREIEHDDVGRRRRAERPPVEVLGDGAAREDDVLAGARARGLEPEPHGLVVVDERDAGHALRLARRRHPGEDGDRLDVVRVREEIERVGSTTVS